MPDQRASSPSKFRLLRKRAQCVRLYLDVLEQEMKMDRAEQTDRDTQGVGEIVSVQVLGEYNLVVHLTRQADCSSGCSP